MVYDTEIKYINIWNGKGFACLNAETGRMTNSGLIKLMWDVHVSWNIVVMKAKHTRLVNRRNKVDVVGVPLNSRKLEAGVEL